MIKISGLFFSILFFLLSGCKDSGTSPEGNNPEENGGKKIFGNFLVQLVSPTDSKAGYTSVLGKFFDGPSISATIWEETASAGNCKLVEPRIPFCETPCTGGAICVEDNVCAVHPKIVTVGKVSVSGLELTTGLDQFDISPIGNNYQLSGGLSINYPGFAEGDNISFEAEGEDSIPSFSLSAKGITELEITSSSIVLEDDMDVVLEWVPPAAGNASNIHLEIDISHHGGVKGLIQCEVPDNGSITIPASMINSLKALGISGFPNMEITRLSSSEHPDLELALSILSKVTLPLEIPGLTSCFEDLDCPDGQTCQVDYRCQ